MHRREALDHNQGLRPAQQRTPTRIVTMDASGTPASTPLLKTTAVLQMASTRTP